MRDFSLRHILVIALIIAGAGAALFFMGRNPFCECGIISFWSGDVLSNQNSQQFADPYTFTHIIHGFGFFLLLHLIAKRLPVGTRAVIAVFLEAIWEVFENTDMVINRYRAETLSLDYYGDSIFNSVGDILTTAFGFLIAARVPVWVTVMLFIFIEATLVFWIRDSLFLNRLMLIYPSEGFKVWQFGG